MIRKRQTQARLPVQPVQTLPLPPGQQQSQHNQRVSWYLLTQQFAVVQPTQAVSEPYLRLRQPAPEEQSCLLELHFPLVQYGDVS